MVYIPSLNKIQYGLEAAFHDAAVDTIEPVGIETFRIDPRVEVVQIPDMQADTFMHEAMVTKRWSEGVVEGYVDYDRFYVYLDGFFGKATPAGNVRTYLGSNDWVGEVPQSLAIRYGQTGALYGCYGVIPYSFSLVYEDGQPLKYAYNFFGGAIIDGATFAAVVVDVPTWAMTHQTELWIDAGIGATVGTTPIADIAFRAEVELSCNRKPIWHLGDQVWDSIISGKWAGSMKLTLEADATNLAQLGDIIDATTTPQYYAIRLRTTDASNILDIDFCGLAQVPPTIITDLEGAVTIELNLVPHYNTALLSCVRAEITIP